VNQTSPFAFTTSRLPDQGRADLASPEVRVGPDEGEDAAEGVRPVPGHREGADAAGGRAADRPEIRVGGQVQALADLGQELLQQEPGIAVAERVVLEAPVVADGRVAGGGRQHAGIEEDTDRDSPLWIRLSKTMGARQRPSSFT
jgi:hypothetical protein